MSKAVALLVLAGIALATWALFGLNIVVDGWNSRIDSKIAFSKAEFHEFLYYSLLAGIAVGGLGLIVAIAASFYRAAISKLVSFFPRHQMRNQL